MGEDSHFDEQAQPNAGQVKSSESEELAALSARVARLERQLASLSERFATTPAGPLTQAEPPTPKTVPAPPPLPSLSTPASVSSPAPPRSLEDRLGSQVFSRVGIIAVLIGAALFLKLAIDSRWIGPSGRVLAGLIGGAGLVVWSERFRRNGFSAFSYSLKAVGSGVLYLSLWAAFQIYHLLPASAALLAMLLVTAWNAYMAWAQNAEVLAAYALIGGCATPLLLSTGGNHEIFLFIYLLAIDLATIALVRLRPWSRLLLGVFPATVIYYIGWYMRFYSAEQFGVTAVFLGLFFAAFASVPLRSSPGVPDSTESGASSRPQRARPSVITEVLLPLANAAFGSLAFYSVLEDSGRHESLPWMVLIFAAVYLGLMRLRQRAAASAVHLSLAIVFLTIAVPLKASGHWITVSWLVEGTALLWVAARLAAAGPVEDDSPADAYRVLRALSAAASLLGLGSILLNAYGLHSADGTAFFNRRFATALVGIAAFSLAAWIALHARHGSGGEPSAQGAGSRREHEQLTWLQIGGASIIAINLIAILATVREIAALWSYTAANPEADLQQALATSAFLMLYGAGLLAVGFWKRTAFVRWQALLLIVYSIAKTFLYDMRNLSEGYRVASFMALGALLMAVSFAYQKDWLALKEAAPQSKQQAGESR
jgi:uncharacterized membrane protein